MYFTCFVSSFFIRVTCFSLHSVVLISRELFCSPTFISDNIANSSRIHLKFPFYQNWEEEVGFMDWGGKPTVEMLLSNGCNNEVAESFKIFQLLSTLITVAYSTALVLLPIASSSMYCYQVSLPLHYLSLLSRLPYSYCCQHHEIVSLAHYQLTKSSNRQL